MQRDGFISMITAVPKNCKLAGENLATKRIGIHRIQQERKRPCGADISRNAIVY